MIISFVFVLQSSNTRWDSNNESVNSLSRVIVSSEYVIVSVGSICFICQSVRA